jgi:HSP20 family protein
MTTQRWDPMREIVALREAMNNMLDDTLVRPRAGVSAMITGMAIDLKENTDNFIVEAVLPGVAPDQVEITVLNDTLRIKAETADATEQEGESWIIRERRHGRFERSITLPAMVNADEATADFENGILRILLPKSEAVRPRTIQVRSARELKDADVTVDVTSGSTV